MDLLFPKIDSALPIKDMVLCELLCQAGIVDDARCLRATAIAKATGCTAGYALHLCGSLTRSQLFGVRRAVTRYLNDPDSLEAMLSAIKCIVGAKKAESLAHNRNNKTFSLKAS